MPASRPADHDVAGDDVVIAAHNVTKRFGNTLALDDVSLEVRRSELLVLLGLSGSGKSTLLRCLNGLHPVTSGTVEVDGTRVDGASKAQLRALRRNVGFVFQHFNLVGRLSCLENVLIGGLGQLTFPRYGALTYPKRMRTEALAHLDRVGLADFAERRADTLSGGQQQRVAIARTLMQAPALLLADEPVASLDPENAGLVMDLLFRVCIEEKLTVVCTLHQVDLALGWAHRLVGLRNGRKVLDRPAVGLTRDEVMGIYQRVDPAVDSAPRSAVT
ncbi:MULTISPECIES: phosphonate ABC transporter ATP-binding protein [Mycolicibacterium]|jgi:phosphonate transport system ATP-binding protein|uniref:Phosphonate ABC transporter, ATPase subunit n=2 Tax=Mycolicibacterium TaxID=1866885 RepID=A1T961_MYCVP|nr:MULTISPECIES: phosphonate ABC transporter ATP-binding protein [Mycolicibacterium]ABM13711.1 phosphonate ABC transporter, ATPase subunit [Mycolicibacterium vanbaalenii PYR-1]MCV7126556.1 phosphonate ABC transporter ATP-binding protein [Mycolicibacterium vanbaalenii PYR-1]MDN4520110.1 phosphonate ABC transporter ATP-binding protein [Mycolicibacterium austroafricanum]MDW5610391.1 phosphonate ABC transporter ATP-binding protein [Mycolicibacterium sp. D5.8-2]PQP48222.1 phosphonate ABC transporte